MQYPLGPAPSATRQLLGCSSGRIHGNPSVASVVETFVSPLSGKRRWVLGFAAVAVAVAVGVVGLTMLRQDGPSPPVSIDGWSGHAILCGYRSERDTLSRLPAERVMKLDDRATRLLVEARCSMVPPTDTERHSIQLRDDRSYVVLNTGRDRFGVALVGVDLSGGRPALKAEVTVSADGCGTTADYRGQLMLLIEAPAGARRPDVSIRLVPLGC